MDVNKDRLALHCNLEVRFSTTDYLLTPNTLLVSLVTPLVTHVSLLRSAIIIPESRVQSVSHKSPPLLKVLSSPTSPVPAPIQVQTEPVRIYSPRIVFLRSPRNVQICRAMPSSACDNRNITSFNTSGHSGEFLPTIGSTRSSCSLLWPISRSFTSQRLLLRSKFEDKVP